nr:hypothetical protein [Paenibacillus sp. AR247]
MKILGDDADLFIRRVIDQPLELAGGELECFGIAGIGIAADNPDPFCTSSGCNIDPALQPLHICFTARFIRIRNVAVICKQRIKAHPCLLNRLAKLLKIAAARVLEMKVANFHRGEALVSQHSRQFKQRELLRLLLYPGDVLLPLIIPLRPAQRSQIAVQTPRRQR